MFRATSSIFLFVASPEECSVKMGVIKERTVSFNRQIISLIVKLQLLKVTISRYSC